MAWFAEVCVAPAEPLGDRAAELAFELDKICSVDLARGRAQAERFGGALTADQVLRLELLLRCLGRDTVLHTAEVGHLALEALIVGQLEKGPSL